MSKRVIIIAAGTEFPSDSWLGVGRCGGGGGITFKRKKGVVFSLCVRVVKKL